MNQIRVTLLINNIVLVIGKISNLSRVKINK